MHGTAEDKAGFALGSPGSSWCRSDQVLICGNATRKFLILVVFYPVKPAIRAFAEVPLLWPGADVLLDPGDDHGGIVSPGTVVHGDAHFANVPWRRNGCAWARRTLNSRQSAETIPTATPRCPPVLSPLLRDGSRVDVLFVGWVGLGVLAGGLRAGLRVWLGEQSGFGLDEDAAADQAFQL
jgi:hypothetical protein